jgi:DNA-binding LytR/AlgR family response regulator
MEVSGIDVARMLRNKVSFVIFVTAHSNHAISAVSDGDSFLLKPIGYATFLDTIEHLINRGKQKKELLS